MVKRYWHVFKFHGPRGVLLAAGRRLFPPRAKCIRTCSDLVAGCAGLEVGGPSLAFSKKGFLPIYPLVGSLDNCNFAQQTIWEGSIEEGKHFRYDDEKTLGYQYIAEASDLSRITTGAYDFLLSSHVLEHLANPLKALREWKRVLGNEGALILIVPHKEGTFDHRRPVTQLSHLLDDFRNDTGEDDLTHLDEVLALHDLDIHPGGCDLPTLRERSCRNFENRCLHQHVFDTSLLIQIVDHEGFQIQAVEALLPFHIIIVARKLSSGRIPNNAPFVSGAPACLATSPFRADRRRVSLMGHN